MEETKDLEIKIKKLEENADKIKEDYEAQIRAKNKEIKERQELKPVSVKVKANNTQFVDLSKVVVYEEMQERLVLSLENTATISVSKRFVDPVKKMLSDIGWPVE